MEDTRQVTTPEQLHGDLREMRKERQAEAEGLPADERSDVRYRVRLMIQSHGSTKVNENALVLPPPTARAFGVKGQFSEQSSVTKRQLLCS